MQTFQNLYTNYQDHTGDTSAGNLVIGKNRINDTNKELLALHDWYFVETTKTFTTTANDYTYDLPYDFGRMVTVRVDISDIHYVLDEVASHEEWQRLQVHRDTYTSDYPTHYHVTGDRIEIYPIPSTTSATADNGTFHYVKRVVDMQYADYVTGTVTLTNASTTVTGSSTVFTAAMVGRFIKGDLDARWYEISGFTSTTVLTLKKAYQGTTTAGLAYTIGEVSLIPEDYHQLLYLQPVAMYWAMKKETDQAAYYQSLFDRGKKEFFNAYSKRTSSQIIKPISAQGRPINTVYGANRWSEPTVLWDQNNEFWGGS